MSSLGAVNLEVRVAWSRAWIGILRREEEGEMGVELRCN